MYVYVFSCVHVHVGAVREHLRSALRQKLSKSRAEERKAIEEKKKLYNEEMGGETDEEEAELTGTVHFCDVIVKKMHGML